ncbi:jumonji domain-containing 2D [Pochonia chlamydosporia 170]|uniref:Jumonji domain-containing 2D n=1 Tax=Pochonia chlamydosporia 170 TaxID=1380566 RepID=A0A179FP47_METCM|nr:jumonji domain-containing 2D [Pochonia chlamydosporia 170]OAQ66843.1 jumonji domain-containing 2D [Pochonia chlamydosporia 170]
MDTVGDRSSVLTSLVMGPTTNELRGDDDGRVSVAFATGDAHRYVASVEEVGMAGVDGLGVQGTDAREETDELVSGGPTSEQEPTDEVAGVVPEPMSLQTTDFVPQPPLLIEDEVRPADEDSANRLETAPRDDIIIEETGPLQKPPNAEDTISANEDIAASIQRTPPIAGDDRHTEEDSTTVTPTVLSNDETQTAPLSPEPHITPKAGDTGHQTTQPRELNNDGLAIKYDYDYVEGHRILRFKPTTEQWDDFPAVLAYARSLGAEGDGCFKVIIPDDLQDAPPEKPAQSLPANAYKVKLIRRTTFWQVSTVPSEGVFASSQEPGSEFSDSVDVALKHLKHLFRKHQNRQLRNIRYRVDVPAWTKTQRRLAGVPERSPIYPLKGDKLDHTKAVIPGIHTPYVYESSSSFGATFQIHAEDFRLASLNHLYKGRKIWIVIPATDVDVAERALGRGSSCSQFMRHRAEFFFPDKLEKLGIPYRIVDQRPGETIVILPDAYHEGFSCGYTIAEAKNYADPAWTTDSYQPCQASCRLATAIPAAFMRPLGEGEQRLDLCAAYGDGLSIPVPAEAPKKRDHEEVDAHGVATNGVEEQEAKRVRVYE